MGSLQKTKDKSLGGPGGIPLAELEAAAQAPLRSIMVGNAIIARPYFNIVDAMTSRAAHIANNCKNCRPGNRDETDGPTVGDMEKAWID